MLPPEKQKLRIQPKARLVLVSVQNLPDVLWLPVVATYFLVNPCFNGFDTHQLRSFPIKQFCSNAKRHTFSTVGVLLQAYSNYGQTYVTSTASTD